jgi:hypothetical protein
MGTLNEYLRIFKATSAISVTIATIHSNLQRGHTLLIRTISSSDIYGASVRKMRSGTSICNIYHV